MDSEEPLGLEIYFTMRQRPLLHEPSSGEKQMVLEDIRGIRCLYRKGNGQGRKYRGRMNGWNFSEAQRQLEYKARWVGLPVVRLSRRANQTSDWNVSSGAENVE